MVHGARMPSARLSRRALAGAALAASLLTYPAVAQSLFERAFNSTRDEIAGLASAAKEEIAGLTDEAKEELAYFWGMEAYAYGLPLVMMDVTKDVLTAVPSAGEWAAPINQFTRAKTYVTPEITNVVRISLNGLWATAFLDLTEPIVVSFPEVGDRFYVAQVMNMWTDNFASIGPRTTGTGAGDFLIVGPDWTGETPEGIKEVYRSSTRHAWILVQTVADGPDDFAAAQAQQDEYRLTPLAYWGGTYTPPAGVPVDGSVTTDVTPFDQVRLMDAQTYFDRLAALMVENPPYEADADMLGKLAHLGIEPGKPFRLSELDPGIGRGLTRAVGDIWGKLATGPFSMSARNGWVDMLNLGAFGTDYETRAAIAWLGLGALSKEDAVYPTAFLDGEGRPLDFTARYTMTFPKDGMLPCPAAWSVSIYQGNFYDANAWNKYDVAPWMKPAVGEDGSLTIYVQPDSPGAELEANWLPSPGAGPMNITIRCYRPEAAMLDGSYAIPPLVRVE